MMYSNEDIKRAIESGDLVVEPFSEELIRAAGLTLHLGKTLLKPHNGKVVDVKNGIVPDFDEITITDDTPYRLEPGEFILGHTLQSVTVGPSLGFLIEGRSTLARVGAALPMSESTSRKAGLAPISLNPGTWLTGTAGAPSDRLAATGFRRSGRPGSLNPWLRPWRSWYPL